MEEWKSLPTKLQRSNVRFYDPALFSRLKPLSAAELDLLPDPAWLVDRHIPEDALSLLYGPYEVGKSFLALDWTLSVATGTSWLGCRVRQGEVVYIVAEGGRGIKKRRDAWLKERRFDTPPAAFHVINGAVDLTDPVERETLVKLLLDAGIKPALIVIDTLARCFGNLDENATKDMNSFVRACDRLREDFPDAAVLIVHHTGKKGERGSRGAVALPAGCDAEFELSRKGSSRELKVLRNKKQKDDGKLPDRDLRLAPAHGSCVVRSADAAPIVEAASKKASAEKSVADRMYDALLTFGTNGARHGDWKTAAEAGGVPVSTFNKHIKPLEQSRRVERRDKFYIAIPLVDATWLAAEAAE
jgi:hypothetical protein